MRIIKITKNISNMSISEMENAVLHGELSKSRTVLQRAYEKGQWSVFNAAIGNPIILADKTCLAYITNMLEQPLHQNDKNAKTLFANILLRQTVQVIKNACEVHSNFRNLFFLNPQISAFALMKASTPKDVVYDIFNRTNIHDPKQTPYDNSRSSSNVLNYLMEYAKMSPWENKESAMMISFRIIHNPHDAFITELSKYHIHPTMASMILKSGENDYWKNEALKRNIHGNTHPPVRLAVLIHDLGRFGSDAQLEAMQFNQLKNVLGQLIITSPSIQYLVDLWNLLVDQLDMQSMESLFVDPQHNIITALARKHVILAELIIDYMLKSFDIQSLSDKTTVENLIDIASKYPSTTALIKNNISEESLRSLRLTPRARNIFIEENEPEIENRDYVFQVMQDVLGENKLSWYKDAKLISHIEQRAGMKEIVTTSILAAIVLVMMGSSILAAAQRMKVKPDELKNALQNQEVVEYAMKLQDEFQALPPNSTHFGNLEELENENATEPQKAEQTDNVMHSLKTRIDTMGEGQDWQILTKVADEYGLQGIERKLLYAIRIIENGRPGLEMGCGDGMPNHPARRFAGNHNKSLELQAQWAAGTISKRFNGDLEGFAQRYCQENWKNWLSMANKFISPSST